MASASSLRGRGRLNAWDTIAAGTTDSALVAAVPGRKIRVIQFLINEGSTTPSSVTFNSKGSGAGTAISPTFLYPANGGTTSNEARSGWFETNPGEGLTVSTGAGSATGVLIAYELVAA